MSDRARTRALADALPALVFAADAEGRYRFTNERYQRYTGLSAEALLGDGWLAAIHPDDRERARLAWTDSVGRRRPYEGEFRFRSRDGDYRWHLCQAEPCLDESDDVVEWVGTCFDIHRRNRAESDSRQIEEALRQRTESLQTLLDTLPVGVMIAHDPDCLQITGNSMAQALLRMSAAENLSHRRRQPLPFRVLAEGELIPPEQLPVRRAARGETVEELEIDLAFDDGAVVHALLSARPLYDPEGRPRGAVATILDISSLQRAQRALTEADRRKDEFLAILAHELRNPLAPLQTGLDLLRLPGATPDMSARAVDTMQRQLVHLVRLVDDLLDVGRISRGRVELQRSHFDLADVCEAAVETAEPLIRERDHRLELVRGPGPATVHGDFHRLTQVVGNLLSNAARYTPPGGSIRLETEAESGCVTAKVSDNGIGIAPEWQGAVFDMFARPQAPGADTSQGLGIGLAIARQLVTMHGGTIEVASDGLGRGSEFTIRLPLAAAPSADQPGEASPNRGAAPGRRVLVVDDNRDAAKSLALLLTLRGHDCEAVFDGAAALAAVQRFQPDLVLLDIGMPDLSGYEVARRLRAADQQRRLTLVAVTGWGQASDKAQARAAGFDEHVTKPLGEAALTRLLSLGVAPTPGEEMPN